ncbi:MAG: ATP-binding cassette domain-containing protein [Firmicutes bacterium]|nr:ATP-binding cassette domain-containing protein [Bacillota bacterium]
MNQAVIKTTGLTKVYGKKERRKCAVDAVSMTVQRGDIYGFIGANGAGKTTFLRMLMGLARPTAGKIELFGEGGAASLTKNRARIGCIIETPALILSMTARDCLTAHKLLIGRREADIDGLLAKVGLSDTGPKKVKDFSLGMKQRLAIAQALMCGPEVLILDEPTNGMDPAGIVEVRNFLKGLASSGITILMSSHILSELEQLATRFGIIADGKLIEEFSAGELERKRVRNITVRVYPYERACALIAVMAGVGGYKLLGEGRILLEDEADFKAVNKLFVKNDIDVEVIEKEAGGLEKYFIEVTNHE